MYNLLVRPYLVLWLKMKNWRCGSTNRSWIRTRHPIADEHSPIGLIRLFSHLFAKRDHNTAPSRAIARIRWTHMPHMRMPDHRIARSQGHRFRRLILSKAHAESLGATHHTAHVRSRRLCGRLASHANTHSPDRQSPEPPNN